mmetsp:Transcript_24636/g.38292  ORF Transcript_24636/g.38292 Transcript_24636/m.38292 type:complete len:111 (+) Transcript_24636:3028-3360(+)
MTKKWGQPSQQGKRKLALDDKAPLFSMRSQNSTGEGSNPPLGTLTLDNSISQSTLLSPKKNSFSKKVRFSSSIHEQLSQASQDSSVLNSEPSELEIKEPDDLAQPSGEKS